MFHALKVMAFAIAIFTGCMIVLCLTHQILLILSRWEVALIMSSIVACVATMGYLDDANTDE